jgi:hypothetical protein
MNNIHNFSKNKVRKVMKTQSFKLKKFKATRIYGFKNAGKTSTPQTFETTTLPTGIMI